jgi:hypothetical protein
LLWIAPAWERSVEAWRFAAPIVTPGEINTAVGLQTPTDAEVMHDRWFGHMPGWARSRSVTVIMTLAFLAMTFGLSCVGLMLLFGIPFPDQVALAAMAGLMFGSVVGAVFFTALTIWQIGEGLQTRVLHRETEAGQAPGNSVGGVAS